jgi:hypothetical protein
VRNIDLQMQYKRDVVAMSYKSGVTGYGNQYLVDITTDGIRSNEIKNFVQKKYEDNIKGYDKKKNDEQIKLVKEHQDFLIRQKELKDKIIASHALHMMMQQTANQKLQALIDECEKIEDELEKKQGELSGYEEARSNAQETLLSAQKTLDDATANYNKILAEHKVLSQAFENMEKQIKAGGKTASDSTRSMESINKPFETTTTVPGNRDTDNSKNKTGILNGIKRSLGFRGTNAENELDLENIANFSAPRENRCTYI